MATQRTRYSTLLAAIHWLTAVLVLIAYLISEGGRRVRLDPPQWHFFLGFAVLLLLVPRLLGRAMGGAPPLAAAGGARVVLAAKAGHALLYLLLVAVPLTGWIAASMMGVTMTLGGITVPPIVAAVQGKIGLIGDVHQWGGNAILILAGLHALAALWHQFYLKDNTLRRMKPF
jgi:cytochrome b561